MLIRVCCRSPIIPARPTFSAEMLNSTNAENGDSNIWTNPLATSHYSASMDNISHRVSVHKIHIKVVVFCVGNVNVSNFPIFQFFFIKASESLDGRVSSRDNHRMPDSVQRELDKRRIGDRYSKYTVMKN